MKRLNLHNDGEEHNFWQNYTDLMSGFLIVFIVASLVAYSSYKIYVDLYHEKGITEANVNDIIINAELFEKIRLFQEAQNSLKSDYFRYSDEYKRFECTIDVQFNPNDFDNIRPEYVDDLIAAGKELESILHKFQEKVDTSGKVKFKVIVEGRLANNLKDGGIHWVTPEGNPSAWKQGLENSYKRALTVVELWRSNNILSDLLYNDPANSAAKVNIGHKYPGELFVSGSGYGGQNRYKYSPQDPRGEDKNKTFIIQIIPYINF
jgi:hypothetical protein